MIYLVFAVIFIHIISAPLILGTEIFIDTENSQGRIAVRFLFIPVYKKKIDIESIKKMLNTSDDKGSERTRYERSRHGGKIGAFLSECAIRTAKRLRVRNADLEAKIGTGDAAADAVAVGMLRIMYSQVCAYYGFNGDPNKIKPDFDAEILYLDFYGIFSLCFADIIFAVLGALTVKTARFGRRRDYANDAE